MQHELFACAEKEVIMIDSDDESTQRLKREGKLTHTISRPDLKDGGVG
jgi:hypothetical protein